MEISVVTIVDRFVGAIVFATSCAVLFWRLDEGISQEAKSSLSNWLNNLKTKQIRPNAIEIFQYMIDKVFGESHFSIQCFARSSVVSIAFAIVVYILLTLNFGYTPSLFAAAHKYSDFWVLFAITMTWNILADYFALLKSRIMVYYMSRKKWIISVILLFFCDLLLTVIIFAVVFQIVLQAIPQILLGAGYVIVYDRDPIYGFYFYEAPESTLALFITTFFTSIWALIYAVSLLSLRILGTLKKATQFFAMVITNINSPCASNRSECCG